MKKVAKFLKIKYSNKLLLPTTAGAPMVANSAWRSSRVKGRIHKHSQARWKRELKKEELGLVRLITSVAAKTYGYKL